VLLAAILLMGGGAGLLPAAGVDHPDDRPDHFTSAQGRPSFDLIWFGVIVTIVMELGLIHPPVGLKYFS